MAMRQLGLSILILLSCALPVVAATGVECSYEIEQRDKTSGEFVSLLKDTTVLLPGIPRRGFPLAFSIDIELEKADSASADLTIHIVTLALKRQNYSQRYHVELGLPARLYPIVGKDDIEYRLTVTPIRQVEYDTADCGMSHTNANLFRFDPSAHLDIYYIPQTLGDFHWNAVKGLMEDQYPRFKEMNHFTLPGKYALYLCPCFVPSVLWDKRFGMAVDPTRNAVFSVYNPSFNSADPFLLWHVSTLRQYGYAPPFLSEGYANYLSLGLFDMKQLLEKNPDLSLSDFMSTPRYLHADPTLADRVATTFVKYLVNQYQVDKFIDCYRQANDLNLQEILEQVYQKPLNTLEAEWRHYVDTASLSLDRLREGAEIAETMRQYAHSLDLLEAAYAQSVSLDDSMRDIGMLARAHFLIGDYYGATEFQEKLVEMDPSIMLLRISLAGYLMMNGDYDAARKHLQAALAIDSTNELIHFNLAVNEIYSNHRQEGLKRLWRMILQPGSGTAQVEARAMLAAELLKDGDSAHREEAVNLYHEVLSLYAQQGNMKPSPSQQMWQGIALLGVGDSGSAADRLNTALFLETRPFYIGMINLWLGKLADVIGDHDAAREYYSQVISGASAVYHQQEARKYLDQPYNP